MDLRGGFAGGTAELVEVVLGSILEEESEGFALARFALTALAVAGVEDVDAVLDV